MMCAKVDASKEDERHGECLLLTASLRAAAIAGEGPERRFRPLPAAHLIVTQVIAASWKCKCCHTSRRALQVLCFQNYLFVGIPEVVLKAQCL